MVYVATSSTAKAETETLPEDASEDPLPGGSGGKIAALNHGVSLTHPDFLLYMAAVRGRKAKRNLMVPCLIESLRNLQPTDNITKACDEAHNKISELVKTNDPRSTFTMITKV